jgi:hypothetical protein
VKNKFVTKCQRGPRTLTDSLNIQPKLWKMDMRFGTRNVRCLYRAGSLMTVKERDHKEDLDVGGRIILELILER